MKYLIILLVILSSCKYQEFVIVKMPVHRIAKFQPHYHLEDDVCIWAEPFESIEFDTLSIERKRKNFTLIK
jgi:hypothetical protein